MHPRSGRGSRKPRRGRPARPARDATAPRAASCVPPRRRAAPQAAPPPPLRCGSPDRPGTPGTGSSFLRICTIFQQPTDQGLASHKPKTSLAQLPQAAIKIVHLGPQYSYCPTGNGTQSVCPGQLRTLLFEVSGTQAPWMSSQAGAPASGPSRALSRASQAASAWRSSGRSSTRAQRLRK